MRCDEAECSAAKWNGCRKAWRERGAAQKNGARAKREQSRARHGAVKHGGKDGKPNQAGRSNGRSKARRREAERGIDTVDFLPEIAGDFFLLF